jgi:polycystin 1L2
MKISKVEYIFKGFCNSAHNLMINRSCHYDYIVINAEKDDYNPNWSILNSNQTINASFVPIYNAFKYRHSSEIDSLPYIAQYSTYLGGGYVFDIQPTENITTVNSKLSILEKLGWIDDKTRALFIEFSLFNPNINLFSYCVIVFEYIPTGSIVKSYQFNPISLYTSTTGFMLLALICNIVYILIIVFLSLREIRSLMKQGYKRYFVQFWAYVDWLLIIFSFVALIMYLYREYEQYTLFTKLTENSNPNKVQQVIRLQKITYWTNTLVVFVAMCSFIGIIKFLNVISYSRNISLLLGTFRRSFVELINFILVFIVVWIGFVSLIFTTYNGLTKSCSTFVKTTESAFLIILGKFSTSAFTETQPIVGPIIFTIFYLVVVIFMANLLVAMIVQYFKKSRKEFNQENGLEDSILMEYIKNKWNTLIVEILCLRRTTVKRRYNTVDQISLLKLRTNQLITIVNDYRQ